MPPLAQLLFAAAFRLRHRYPGETRLALLVAAVAVSGIAWAATVLRDVPARRSLPTSIDANDGESVVIRLRSSCWQ